MCITYRGARDRHGELAAGASEAQLSPQTLAGLPISSEDCQAVTLERAFHVYLPTKPLTSPPPPPEQGRFQLLWMGKARLDPARPPIPGDRNRESVNDCAAGLGQGPLAGRGLFSFGFLLKAEVRAGGAA